MFAIGVVIRVVCVVAIFCRAASAADSAALAAFALEGFKDGRERFRSGIVRITGRQVHDRQGRPGAEGEIRYFIAFDDDKSLLRFDSDLPSLAPSAGQPIDRPSTSERLRVKLIETSDRIITWSSLHTDVYIDRPEMRGTLYQLVRPFDVRALGVITSLGTSQYYSFLDLHRILATLEVEEASEPDANVYRIVWRLPTNDDGTLARAVLWLNGAEGFAPFHLQRQDQLAAGRNWNKPHTESEATWTEIAGVWVPRTYTLRTEMTGDFYEMNLDWEQVNGSVPDSLFKPLGFDVGTSADLIDRRLGKDINLGRVQPPRPPSTSAHIEARPHVLLILVLNAVMIAAILMFYFLWRRRTSKPQ